MDEKENKNKRNGRERNGGFARPTLWRGWRIQRLGLRGGLKDLFLASGVCLGWTFY